jgi:hypothetical protein
MVGAKPGFADSESAFVNVAGAFQVTEVLLDDAEVVEAPGSVGVVGAQPGLADDEAALMEVAART